MGTRRKSRELAMQMLFQADLGKQQPADVRRLFWNSREADVEPPVKGSDGKVVKSSPKSTIDPETQGFADDLFRVATERSEEIDSLIEQHAQNWRLERMAVVDRNLLRMAIGEMLGFPSTPHPIVINEALEIGRRYAAPESVTFLNGVLDAVGRTVMERRLK